MRKGYLNLVENLKLLNMPEATWMIASIDLQSASGRVARCAEVVVKATELFGKIHGEPRWVQMPIDELVGFSVEFAPGSVIQSLPTALSEARKLSKPIVVAITPL